MLKMLVEAEPQARHTFIGAALIKFASGIVGIWGSINLYFFSYFKHQGTPMEPKTNSIILLCTVIPSAFAMLASTTLSRLFGYKTVVRVCGFLFALTPYMINIKLNTFILGFCFLFIPVSCMSISSVPALNCLWSQFPGHLNKVSGAAVLFFSAGSIIFNLVFTFIVNPYNQKAAINSEGQAFFSPQTSEHIFKASNIIFAISGICFILGSFLIHKKETVPASSSHSRNGQLVGESTPKNHFESVPEECLSPSGHIEKPTTLKQTLTDKRFLVLFGISYILPQYLIYLNLYMKLIFMPIVNDDHYLATCAIVVTLSAIIAAPTWGALGDCKGFRKTLLAIVVVDICCKGVGLLCQQKWNIILLYFCLSFTDKGILTIIGPGLIQMFGLEMATELIPYKGLSLFLAFITVPAFQLLFSSLLNYKLILAMFLALSGLSLGMALYFYFKVEYVRIGEPEESEEKDRFEEKDVDNYIP